MRLLHVFEDERDAERLKDALFVEGIAASVREGRDGDSWQLLVHDDEQIDDAKVLLERFQEAPDDPLFAARQKEAKAVRKAAAKEEAKSRHREERARKLIDQSKAPGLLTIGFIGFSVGLYFLTEAKPEIGRALMMQPLGYVTPGGFQLDVMATLMRPFETGEVWRFVAGTFLHGSLLHLGFNCLWLYSLGTLVERQHGAVRFFVAMFLLGIASELAEVLISAHPSIGLSGNVYGLFGFLWMRGRYDPTYPYRVPRSTVMWMMVWYVLCFTGFMPIANGAHTAGLVLGGAYGFLTSGYLRRKRARPGA